MPTMIRMKTGNIVIVVGTDLEQTAEEIATAAKCGERVTFRPIYFGDDQTGEMMPPEPIAVAYDEIKDLTETRSPLVRSDGVRIPRNEWHPRHD